jgi:hypothetical protein
MEIMKASRQWSTRPDDERFITLESLHNATVEYERELRERDGVEVSTLRTESANGDVVLVGRGNVPSRLTHWAFGQLAQRIGAPASYLRDLPAELASQNINHGLAKRAALSGEQGALSLLVHVSDTLTVNALTSSKYERIWNREVTERLLGLKSDGWDVATPDLAFGAGFDDGKRPLYASDHDIFAFVCSQNTVRESGNPDGLKRGVIVENSTVGASKLRLTRFLYRGMCGNHIIWNASEVTELALTHRGNIRDRMHAWDVEIKRYMNESATEDENRIESAKRKLIAATKEDVLDALFGKRIPALTRKALGASYDAVHPSQDGDARSVWGIVQGITRYSQTLPYGDVRTDIDRAAGQLLNAF